MNIGKNITILRRSHGITQEKLAETLDVSRQTIYKWEANIAIPKVEKIMEIVRIFGISYDEFFKEDFRIPSILDRKNDRNGENN